VALTAEQREELKDVLGNAIGYVGGRKIGTGMEDVRALLMEEESDGSDNESDNDSSGEGEGEEGESMDGVSDRSSEPDESRKFGNGKKKQTRSGGRKTSQDTDTTLRLTTDRGCGSSGNSVVPNFSSPLGFIVQATLEEQADHEGYFQSSEFILFAFIFVLLEAVQIN
jgi:hypothetical protein